jgi:glycosyltransferase involved in cell wall biosynthesis
LKIAHHMRRENSGLVHTTLELVEEEQRQGHQVRVLEPSGKDPMMQTFDGEPDVTCIHSQLHSSAYHDGKPKIMWMHGEPIGSVGNGISMRAIVDLAKNVDAFICMRQEEWPIWNSIRKTYVVPKGVDLTRFVPKEVPKLSGNPAILYYENWRGHRNPLILCRAMEEVIKVLPEAKLHLYNCPGGKMQETFQSLINHCRWYTFVGSLKGQEADVVTLLNKADIVVSGLYPLYARGIEAFGCGKAFIGPGYREHDYPWQCELEPYSMAKAIHRCWAEVGSQGNEYATMYFRKWAEKHHDVKDSVEQSIEVYKRYV